MMLPTYLIYCTNTQSQLEQTRETKKKYVRASAWYETSSSANRRWPLFTWYKTNCIWTTTACSFLHSSHTFASYFFLFFCLQSHFSLVGRICFFFFFSFATILFSRFSHFASVVCLFYRATELCSLHFTYIAVSRVFNLYVHKCFSSKRIDLSLIQFEINWKSGNKKKRATHLRLEVMLCHGAYINKKPDELCNEMCNILYLMHHGERVCMFIFLFFFIEFNTT